MNKHLSQEKRDTLASEFTYQGKKSGMIGGYCEADFPLYYANEEMAELLGYGSVEELAAGDRRQGGEHHPPRRYAAGRKGPRRTFLRGHDL